MSFDIFITVGPSDFEIIKYTLNLNLKNINNYKNIYIHSEFKNFNFDKVNNINQSFFPFSRNEITDLIKNKSRAGWIYQQLVGLYYPFIQNNSENVLVIDSDVFFTKKIDFQSGSKNIFTVGYEYHKPYFDHMKLLHPDLVKHDQFSGISHHMIYNKTILKDLIKKVEDFHSEEFYKVFIKNLNKYEISGAADYEIYYNFALKNYKDMHLTRELVWTNLEKFSINNFFKYDFVSLPHYEKTRPGDFLINLKEFKLIRALYCLKNFLYLKLVIRKIKLIKENEINSFES